MLTIYRALIITPRTPTQLDIYQPGYLAVTPEGTILELSSQDLRQSYPRARFVDYADYLIVPGFIDTHNHLPQYAFAGLGDQDLLPWLKKYTFPREQTFADPAVAGPAAQNFFQALLQHGTTTTATYVTIHPAATDLAFRSAEKTKIRALIGKVMMDQHSPRALTENTAAGRRAAPDLIDRWHGRNHRLFYALTPRFAITCTFPLLEQVGRLARAKQVYIQTHLAENMGEIAFTKKIAPQFKNYTAVYAAAGLLGPRTIMAHAIHLAPEEVAQLRATHTKIAHCPTSNRFLRSGIMPYRHYHQQRLTLGLGSDVAGGYSLSLWNEMKEAIESSKTLHYFTDGHSGAPMTVAEAFYLATLGGAHVLSLEKDLGSLLPGKQADFQVIDYHQIDPQPQSSPYTTPEQILSRLIYRGHVGVTKQVYIQGEALLTT